MTERNNFYDCIRALAAALVLMRHCDLLPGGSLGINMFFCLSGFLITQLLLQLPELSRVNVAIFIFRRFMRVWPMMAFQVFLTLGLTVLLRSQQDVRDYIAAIPGLLTFTSSVGWVNFSAAILWTLRAEFWFYVLFALAVYAAGRRAIFWIAISGIAVSWPAKYFIGHARQGMFGGSFPQELDPIFYALVYLDNLMVGALCACIVARNHPALKVLYANRVVSLWMPLAVILVLATLNVRAYNIAWHFKASAVAFLTGVLILHQWANPLKGDYEPLATLGRISFSIYLLHAVVVDYLPLHGFPPAQQFLTVGGIVVVVSSLTYRWIEKPFILMSKTMAPFRPPSRILFSEPADSAKTTIPLQSRP
jgi:peptidoglycan/LPS O-acetylase OafA/YrhL